MADKPKVTIVCTAFNHERYIRQTLDGFVMQKTDFPFIVLVSDDASTDRTAEIIHEYEVKYPEIIRPVYMKENQYNKGIACADVLFNMVDSEYAAWCEGDDFWIDENKLQMQVDFMDAHPDYSLCAHAAYTCYEDGVFMEGMFRPFTEDKTVTTEEAMSAWRFSTASLFYRTSMRPEIPAPFQGNAPSSDYSTVVYLALNGKVHYIDRPMCVYRRNSVSSLSRMNAGSQDRTLRTLEGLCALADRIDAYSAQKYTQALRVFKAGCEYNRLMLLNDRKEIKGSPYTDLFSKGQKLRLAIKPWLKWLMPLREAVRHRRAPAIHQKCREAMKTMPYDNIVLLDTMK